MELKEAIENVKCALIYPEEDLLEVEEGKESLNTLLEIAELVEAMRGKLPEKKKHGLDSDVFVHINSTIDDCAAAYVANLPSVEEFTKFIEASYCGRLGYQKQLAIEIHALLVSKIRGEK